jgi:deoxyribonuclease V
MKEEEAIQKGIDLEKLKEEQKKLAKTLEIEDAFDFSNCQRYAAIVVESLKNRELIASIAVLDEDMKLIEDKYLTRMPKFPYIPGFRAYRELPIMQAVYEKIEEQPDVIFILGQGIPHPQGLGIASHLSLSINKPVIGITQSLAIGEEKGDEVYIGKKLVAKKIQTKEKSRPIYVSPGNLISLKTAIEITKKCLREPHKLPEPIVMARKTIGNVKKELNL